MNEIVINALIVVATIVGLWFGATWLVEGAVRLARKVGLSELIIGLTVVAMGTSMPEFAVTTTAALNGQSDISVGNIVGSNIFNLAIILGGVVAIRAIATNKKLVYRDGIFLVVTSFLVLFFLRDLQLVQWEGIVLIVTLIGYIIYLISQREMTDEELPEGEFTPFDIARLLIGFAIVALSGRFLVTSSTAIAETLGVSDWIIAVTVVAAGTSAPEMAASFVAAVRGYESISIGNLIGSDLFNKLGVLGLAALLQRNDGTVVASERAVPGWIERLMEMGWMSEPTGVGMMIEPAGFGSILTLCIMVTIVVWMMWTGWKLSRWEGLVLLAIGIARWSLDIYNASGA